ncbi:MAG: hypothetical protein ACP5GZ_03415 [Vulcanisaeta sp.]|uniref:hypothetical protein n=1 Tax=Vulcanisaeta sp. TaxID=2020871 RepID=UPI003D0972B1
MGVEVKTQPVGLGRICWGVKRGKRFVCGEPVTDEAVIEEVKGLVEELRGRVKKHRNKLEDASFIDGLINLLEQWLEEHKNDRGRKVREARKVVGKMIELLRKLKKKWIEKYWRQLLELMDLLEKNATEIIVTGRNNGEESLVAHIYNKDVAVAIDKAATSESIIIWLSLSRSEGDDVKISSTFSNEEILRTVQYGWELTDGGINRKHPAMGTSQPWQTVLWSLTYPGEIHMLISGIGINEDEISVKWYLTANDHEAKPREEIVEEIKKLDIESLKAFLAPAIWGDGNVSVDKKSIKLIMGLAKYELWLGIIERMINELGFAMYPKDYIVEIEACSSNAVKLARDWLAMRDVKELIELGSDLGGEKLKRIIELASKEIKKLGSSSINIPGTIISMTVNVRSDCRVELRTKRKSENEALRIIEELRRAGYEVTKYVKSEGHVVLITHANIRDNPKLKPLVCGKLSEWLNEKKDERMKKRIATAMQNLKCFNNA